MASATGKQDWSLLQLPKQTRRSTYMWLQSQQPPSCSICCLERRITCGRGKKPRHIMVLTDVTLFRGDIFRKETNQTPIFSGSCAASLPPAFRGLGSVGRWCGATLLFRTNQHTHHPLDHLCHHVMYLTPLYYSTQVWRSFTHQSEEMRRREPVYATLFINIT